jgi:hypothetical protein
MKNKPTILRVEADILVDEIAEDLSQEQAFELIKAIDLWQADYGFTERLRDYLSDALDKEDGVSKLAGDV